MSMYELPQLIKKWERAELTSEQTIGQLIQHLQRLSERLGQIERQLEQWRPTKSNQARAE